MLWGRGDARRPTLHTPHDAGAPKIAGEMTPTWFWTQAAIVLFVLAGMVIAIVKLA